MILIPLRPISDSERAYLLTWYPRCKTEAERAALAKKLHRSSEEITQAIRGLEVGGGRPPAARRHGNRGQGGIQVGHRPDPGSYFAAGGRSGESAPAAKGYAAEKYQRVVKGWRTIGGKRHYFRSQWEMNVACYLEFIKNQGQITDWEYEPETFWFHRISRGIRSYCPDFRLHYPDGRIIYWEVKGFMDSKSRTKIKRMRKYYPQEVLEVVDAKRYRRLQRSAAMIPGWSEGKMARRAG